jgi:hypothetical protein
VRDRLSFNDDDGPKRRYHPKIFLSQGGLLLCVGVGTYGRVEQNNCHIHGTEFRSISASADP